MRNEENPPQNDILGRKLDLLLYTGRLLTQCLADSNRIDRNLRRVAAYMGIPFDKFHMHINYTTLMINISEGSRSITKLIKCKAHGPNMNVLAEISKLTWRALRENYSLDEYDKQIKEIGKMTHLYPRPLLILAAGIACGCFSKLFGADLPAVVMTMLASAIAIFVRQELHKRHLNHYMMVLIAAFTATFIAALASRTGLSATPNHPIIACVLFLIPGIPLINSVDDMIDGFTIVGVTRAVNATLIIGAIAFGMLIALELLRFDSHSVIIMPNHQWIAVILAAACAATGFAMLFNVPRHALVVCALGGVVAVTIRNYLHLTTEIGLVFSTLMGAFAVGCAAIYLIHKVHLPANVITIPAVIPLIPGVVMYEAMISALHFSSAGGEEQVILLTQTAQAGITAFMTVLAISIGITVPNIIGRRYFSRKEKEFEIKYPGV